MQILPTLAEAPFSCSDSDSAGESEGGSEDEPLIRRVASREEFRQSSVEYQSSDEDAVMEEVSEAEKSENEGTSEEESDIDSECDDNVEFLGRESALSRKTSQELLSRWVLPVVIAMEI